MANTTSPTSSPFKAGGKFATMRAPPPLTAAEAEAQPKAGPKKITKPAQATKNQNQTPEAAQATTAKGSITTINVDSATKPPKTGNGHRPVVPPKELKPRLISSYVPGTVVDQKPTNGVTSISKAKAEPNTPQTKQQTSKPGTSTDTPQESQDWEKEAAKLKELLEKEQQARKDLEQRVQELEQQLGQATAT